jgi:hypothetical protein
LVFLPSDGPAQLATGALITFLFLLLNLICRPFCSPGLNNLQSFSLISQFLTLFCGILIGFREAMQTSEASKGSDSAEREEARLFGSIIVFINCGTLAFPLARKIMTGKHIELMEKIISFLKLPFKCYMAWCGGKRRLDARIAGKRQERAARLRAQFVHTELPAAPAVRDEPAASSPARSKNTTVNADVPISPAPIVVSGPLSGINFKDTAVDLYPASTSKTLGVDLVLSQDVGVDEAQPRLAVVAPDLCVGPVCARRETMSDFLIGGRRQERGDGGKQEKLL